MIKPGLAVTSLALVLAAGFAPAQPSKSLAEVNGKVITAADLAWTIVTLGSKATGVPADAGLRHQMIENLVDRDLLANAAKQAGIEEDAEFKRRLEFSKTDVLIQRFLEIETAKLDDVALRNYFTSNIDRFSRKEVRVARLFTHDLAKAKRWHDALARNPRRFGDLAAAESEDGSQVKTRGDLGFMRSGMLEEPINRFAFSNSRGAISDVLTLADGYVVATILDIKPGKPVAYADIKEDVARLAKSDVERAVIKNLRKHAAVIFHDEAIRDLDAHEFHQ